MDAVSGAVELRDAPAEPGDVPGEVRLEVPAGFIVDSAGGPEGPAQSDGVTYTLVDGADGSQSLRVDLSDWLEDPARVWPVFVDPSLQVASAPVSDDTYVVDGETGVYHHTETTLKVGYSGSAAQRALINFPVTPNPDVAVHYAELVLTPTGSCPSTVPLTLSAATSAWAGSTIEWPGPTAAAALLPDATGYGMVADCSAGKVRAQVTPIVQDWAHGGLTPRGFVLAAQNETDAAQLREFHAQNHGTSADRPVLDIVYSITDEDGPDAPSALTPAGELSTVNPTLIARYTHPEETDGGLLFALRIDASDLVLGFGFFGMSPGSPLTIASGTRGGIVIGGGLPPGREFEWRATAWNMDESATAWSEPAEWQAIETPDTVGCSGPGDDPGEQNDTFANATAWDGTTEVEGLVCNDPDVFGFETTGTPDLEVTVEFDGDADLDVAIYDATGTLVELLDSTDPSESYEFDEAGTFYVEVYGYRGASGTYTLHGVAL